ncbi:hypothetical protein FNV43_RR13856 [Rhamnella rubrinervis]|uniref:Uncharacterized protein n=1 Tax=Rhamnella rubrinervis TaxID=2594499 RepID=A0A8K0H1S6_9ROSA|nr:hypothetical protein FNV43_RR13856 [Rhamnella rubrinervis]
MEDRSKPLVVIVARSYRVRANPTSSFFRRYPDRPKPINRSAHSSDNQSMVVFYLENSVNHLGPAQPNQWRLRLDYLINLGVHGENNQVAASAQDIEAEIYIGRAMEHDSEGD